MWAPEPAWEPLPAGPATSGLWRAERDGLRWVVKRLQAPRPEDPAAWTTPSHPAYWRREADVVAHRLVQHTPGLHGPEPGPVDEDAEGITVWQREVALDPPTGLEVARALGRFAQATLPSVEWLAADVLAARLDAVATRGGWAALTHTSAAGLAARLWERRTTLLDDLRGLPQVVSHGDPVPGNLVGRTEVAVVAVDWGTLGVGPAGGDLGYFALSTREDLDVLVDVYAGVSGLAVADVRHGARVTAAYTVLTRVDRALTAAGRHGAAQGALRHPAVAPYLRALQRLYPALEPLAG